MKYIIGEAFVKNTSNFSIYFGKKWKQYTATLVIVSISLILICKGGIFLISLQKYLSIR
jgi:hypothetical protein